MGCIPAWLLFGCSAMVLLLFFAINMTPKTSFIVFCCSVAVLVFFFTINMTVKTSFVVFDFWRWLVVHLWGKVMFKFSTTVFVTYLYRELCDSQRRCC